MMPEMFNRNQHYLLMATDPNHILQQNHELLADICHRRMAIDSLLMSYSTIEEKRAEYQRDFNNYKHYEI
jgi:hypothetical protein